MSNFKPLYDRLLANLEKPGNLLVAQSVAGHLMYVVHRRHGLEKRMFPRLSFPGSAWECTALAALPPEVGVSAAFVTTGRSRSGSAFPGRAWERAVARGYVIFE